MPIEQGKIGGGSIRERDGLTHLNTFVDYLCHGENGLFNTWKPTDSNSSRQDRCQTDGSCIISREFSRRDAQSQLTFSHYTQGTLRSDKQLCQVVPS